MSDVNVPALWRRLLAEAVGTCLLVAVVAGSGIAAQRLSPRDAGVQLLQNSTATVLGLAVLILIFGPVSGAHFNPMVSAANWLLARRAPARLSGLTGTEVLAYTAAQTAGAVIGAVTANTMYGLDAVQISGHERATMPNLFSEAVATGGLILLVFALARNGRGAWSAAAVGAYIGSAYWFTASTSFANPAVTTGRIFTDTFSGIAPASVPAFVLAQVVGAGVGLALVLALYPDPPQTPTAPLDRAHPAGSVVPAGTNG